MTAVAIYIRWSTDDQSQGTTLAVQLEACHRYCGQNGWHVSEQQVYVDDGYSGGTLLRPEMERLRTAVRTGAVSVVVVYRLDRLSRNLADATHLVDREWKGLAIVRSATEDVLPERDEGWLNYSFRATFADYERRVILQRTYSGRLRRLHEGKKVQGRAPYGWKTTATPCALAIDGPAATVVRTLFRKCAHAQMGGAALARWANQEGIPSPRGKRWSGANLRRMLISPVYGGRLVFGRQRRRKSSRAEPGPWLANGAQVIEVPADPTSLPPILPPGLWEQAQAALQRRSERFTRGSGVTHPRLLTGLVCCPCGGTMGTKCRPAGRDRHAPRTRYYRCRTDATAEPCSCRPGYIHAETLESRVEAEFLSRVRTAGFQFEMAGRIAPRWHGEMRTLQAQRDAVHAETRRLEDRLAFIDQEYLRRVLTIAEARRLRAGIEEKHKAQQARLATLAAQLQRSTAATEHAGRLWGQPKSPEPWHRLTLLERKAVLQHFIQRIDVNRPRHVPEVSVTIYWAARSPPARASSRLRKRPGAKGARSSAGARS